MSKSLYFSVRVHRNSKHNIFLGHRYDLERNWEQDISIVGNLHYYSLK